MGADATVESDHADPHRISSTTFYSYREPHLCTDNAMVRGMLRAVRATTAKQEDKRLSERVIAGMRRAAAKGTKSGKPIGRPRVSPETEKAIQRLLRGGTGINKCIS